MNFYDFKIADIFMRVLRAIVLSGSSDNTIILRVLSTDDPLSTWYVNTFKIWYLDRLELRRDLISFPFTIYDLYNRIEIARFFGKIFKKFFSSCRNKEYFFKFIEFMSKVVCLVRSRMKWFLRSERKWKIRNMI